MPLISTDEAIQSLNATSSLTGFAPQPQRVEKVEDKIIAPEPEVGEELAAAFRQENMVVSLIAAGQEIFTNHEFDESYNYLDDIDGYEEYENVLALAKNKRHATILKDRIEQERLDRDILERGGMSAMLAQFAAGIFDPTILVPIGGVTYKGLKGISQIAKASATTAATVGVQEVGLQQTQLLRTKEESINAMIGGAIFAGALGGVGYSLLRKSNAKEAERIKSAVIEDISEGDNIIPLKDVVARNDGDTEAIKRDLSIGAAQVTGVDIKKAGEQNRKLLIAGETIENVAGIEKVLGRMTPLLATLQSDLVSSRQIMQRLLSNPLRMEKNAEFKATAQSVEQLREQYYSDFLNTQSEVTDIYKGYKKRIGGNDKLPLTRDNVIDNIKSKVTGTPIKSSFMEEVGKALRRGETHPIPEVQEAASKYRKFYDDIANEAIKVGVWDDMPTRKTAESYFSRVFDIDAIEENLPEFRQIVKDWTKEQVEDSVNRLNQKYDRLKTNYQSQIDELEVNEFRKASFLQEQAELEGKEFGLTLEDVKASLDYLAGGKPRKPKTLVKYIAEQGGIDIKDVNFKGLNFDDIQAWAKTNRTRLANEKTEGGLSLDEVAFRAWEEGYFPELRERPTVDEIISIIDDELRDISYKVKPDDTDAWNDWNYYNDVKSTIDAMGIKPKDYRGGKILLDDSSLKGVRDNLIKASESQAKRKINDIKAKIAKLDLKKKEEFEDIDAMGVDMYSEDVAENIIDNIRGIDRVMPDFKFDITERGPLKAQKFLIPDEAIEKFLVNDADIVAEKYSRSMGTDIELIRNFGSTKFEDVLEPVVREFKEQESKLKTAKERAALKKNFDRDKSNLEALHQIIKGTYAGDLYSQPDKWYKALGRTAMAYNYIRMLGGVAVSSIPDIAKQIQYNGMFNSFKDGFAPFAKTLPTLFKGMRPDELKELKLAGTTIEHLTNARALSLADMFQRHGPQSSFEKYIDGTTKVFSRATGITLWNNTMQAIGGIMSQKRITRNLEAIAKGKDIDVNEKKFLSVLGIDKEDAIKMQAEIKKHGEKKKDGFVIVNSDKWEDRTLARQWRVALKKDVESIVLQKDLGDVPLFANSGLGRIILQFKSFMFASTNKTLMAGLQRRDRSQMEALATFIALGALTYIIKEKERGAEPDYNPANLIVQGIDRSGVLGVFMEANNVFEKVGGKGIGRLAGQPPASRYYSRSLDEALLGPSLGTISNIGRAAYSGFSDEDLTKSDKRNLRKLVPFNNLFYLRWLAQNVDSGTRAEFGY